MRRAWVIVLCTLGMFAAADSARAVKKPPSTKPSPEDAFYGAGKIYNIHLRVTEASWTLMQPTRRVRHAPIIADEIPPPATQPAHAAIEPTEPPDATAEPDSPAQKKLNVEGEKLPPNNYGFEYVYVKAQFELDDERVADVGLRFKGNSSYENTLRTNRRPMKVDFNRFVPKQKFRGIQTFNLANNAFDLSHLRETVSYEVYRMAGVPAPRTALANVYLTVDGLYDRELVGLYTIVEEVDDKPFLKTHFGSAKGVLMKPEGCRGLPYMGETFENYADRYRSKIDDYDPKTARRFIDFVKLVNYADDAEFRAKIDDYLDVDGFLRYLAASVLVATLDSPLANNHNYYLYVSPTDGKVRMLPWDMNLAFGSFGMNLAGDNQVNLSVAQPYPAENKMFRRVMEIPEHHAKYRAYLRRFATTFFNADGMSDVFAKLDCALVVADEAATAAGRPSLFDTDGGSTFNGGGRSRGRFPPIDYVPARSKSVLDQLDGKDVPAYVPRMNPPMMVHRFGLNAPAQFGVLSWMAQGVRKAADRDGDFRLSGREARDAAAALFYQGVDEEKGGDALTEAQLAHALTPLLKTYATQTARGGFFNNARTAYQPATLWARAAFALADGDGDAKLTLDELTNLVDRTWCAADRDRSGYLDDREVSEALDAIAAPGGVAAPVPAEPDTTRRRRR